MAGLLCMAGRSWVSSYRTIKSGGQALIRQHISTTDADLVIGGVNVPKGKYTLFTVPSATGWKLIVNKVTGQWGIPYKPEYEKEELGRADMKVETLPSAVEMFTISLDKAGSGGVIKMEWEKTRASVNFTAK